MIFYFEIGRLNKDFESKEETRRERPQTYISKNGTDRHKENIQKGYYR